MTKKTTLVLLLPILFLSGCSIIKTRLYGVPAQPQIKTIKYDFIHPRRTQLGLNTANQLTEIIKNGKNSQYSYYSASGYICRNLSLKTPRSACLVEHKWKVTAPVLDTFVIDSN